MTTEQHHQQQHPSHAPRAQIAILDFGSQYSHLIARRLRELHVFCELYSCLVTKDELFGGTTEDDHPKQIIGIILSGGPNSVYDPMAPHVSEGVWKEIIEERKIPLLGICYGMQELAHGFGGKVAPCEKREYGKATVVTTADGDVLSPLLAGLPNEFDVWMSHGDKLHEVPTGFQRSSLLGGAMSVV